MGVFLVIRGVVCCAGEGMGITLFFCVGGLVGEFK